MPPHEGLVHPKEYDWRDSNVELVGSHIDHQVKYNSAATEPAWNDGKVGSEPGLLVWRIENFEVVPWPQDKYGQFHEGDSYIVLHSYKVGKQGQEKLGHDIFFWLGSHTSQDEAGVAAYKTVELDEFLHGVAAQHREVQAEPSADFLALFPKLKILSGGVRTGFRHVEDEEPKEYTTLLRVFKHPRAARADSVIVHEVPPTAESLDEDDVFVLDKGDKIWVWQGKNCSPMEKAKAAQVVHDMTLAKHVDVEVLSQSEARARVVEKMLGVADEDVPASTRHAQRPMGFSNSDGSGRPRRLMRLSDASGNLTFDTIKNGEPIRQSDLDGNDVFIIDSGNAIWVWQGQGASRGEKAMWLKAAQAYVRQLEDEEAYRSSIAKVVEGNESPAFLKAIEAY